MKFKLQHHFACSPETYWKIAVRDDIDEESAAQADGTVELLSLSEADGIVTRRQRFVMNRSLPKSMKKVLGTDSIGYELEVVVTRGTNSARWTITPLVIPDRVTGGGTVLLTTEGDGCVRTIEGELNVRVPIVGKAMEKRLIDDVTKSYDTNAQVISAHIARGDI